MITVSDGQTNKQTNRADSEGSKGQSAAHNNLRQLLTFSVNDCTAEITAQENDYFLRLKKHFTLFKPNGCSQVPVYEDDGLGALEVCSGASPGVYYPRIQYVRE